MRGIEGLRDYGIERWLVSCSFNLRIFLEKSPFEVSLTRYLKKGALWGFYS